MKPVMPPYEWPRMPTAPFDHGWLRTQLSMISLPSSAAPVMTPIMRRTVRVPCTPVRPLILRASYDWYEAGGSITFAQAGGQDECPLGHPSRRYVPRSEVPRSPVATSSYFPAASPS